MRISEGEEEIGVYLTFASSTAVASKSWKMSYRESLEASEEGTVRQA
jgi:hypothetical protein